MDAMQRIIEKFASNRTEPNENEYIAEDGLIHCRKCKKPVQTIVRYKGSEAKVKCVCQCFTDEYNAHKLKELKEKRERMRDICFHSSNMKNWTFENDDRNNQKVSDAMMKYADNFKDFFKISKGLLLYGGVGTGKTYYAACIANRLIDNDFKVLMTNFATLTNKIQGLKEDKNEYIESLNSYSLLIIDDLGAERNSEYMQEMVFNIIDSRYRSGKPMIITTNLSGTELKNPKDTGYSRIYDRVLERCFPIEVVGSSRRQEELKNTYSEMKKMLGL